MYTEIIWWATNYFYTHKELGSLTERGCNCGKVFWAVRKHKESFLTLHEPWILLKKHGFSLNFTSTRNSSQVLSCCSGSGESDLQIGKSNSKSFIHWKFQKQKTWLQLIALPNDVGFPVLGVLEAKNMTPINFNAWRCGLPPFLGIFSSDFLQTKTWLHLIALPGSVDSPF